MREKKRKKKQRVRSICFENGKTTIVYCLQKQLLKETIKNNADFVQINGFEREDLNKFPRISYIELKLIGRIFIKTIQ